MASRSLASQRLNRVIDFGFDAIATCNLDGDFMLTRDKRVMDEKGDVDRFSYKVAEGPRRGFAPTKRMAPAPYRAVLIASVDASEWTYEDNPFQKEVMDCSSAIILDYLVLIFIFYFWKGYGCDCIQLTMRCPTGVDKDTLRFFNLQISKLYRLVENDLVESVRKSEAVL